MDTTASSRKTRIHTTSTNVTIATNKESHNWLVKWSWGLLRPSWWLNWTNPHLKKYACPSNWIIFPQLSRWKFQKMFELPPPRRVNNGWLCRVYWVTIPIFQYTDLSLGGDPTLYDPWVLEQQNHYPNYANPRKSILQQKQHYSERKIKLKLNTKFNQSPPPPTTSTQHQPWIFLGTQARWSRNSASIHSGLPGKAHQDAKTCSFSQVLGGFHLGRWDRTTSKLITGHANLNEVETKIAKPKMCQTCPILFSKTAKMHVKRDHYGIYGPISTKSLHLLRDHSRHLNQSS